MSRKNLKKIKRKFPDFFIMIHTRTYFYQEICRNLSLEIILHARSAISLISWISPY